VRIGSFGIWLGELRSCQRVPAERVGALPEDDRALGGLEEVFASPPDVHLVVEELAAEVRLLLRGRISLLGNDVPIRHRLGDQSNRAPSDGAAVVELDGDELAPLSRLHGSGDVERVLFPGQPVVGPVGFRPPSEHDCERKIDVVRRRTRVEGGLGEVDLI
jgi:hypothetical protein